MLTARHAEGLRGLLTLKGDWERLHRASGAGLFQSFAWAEAWSRAIEGLDQGEIRILVVEDEGRLCIVPLILQRRLGIRRLRWLGMEVTDHCDVIASDGWDPQVLGAFVRANLPPADSVELRQIKPGSLASALFASRLNDGAFDQQCPRIVVTESHAPKDILYAERRIKAVGTVAYHVARDAAERADIVRFVIFNKRDALMRQRRSTSEFDRAVTPFLRSLADLELPGSAAPYLSRLALDGQTIAAQIGFIAGKTMFYYLPAFDVAFGRHSPGHLLILNLLRDAQTRQLEVIDLLRGQESYKFKWANSVEPLAAAEWTATWRGRAFDWARQAKRRI